MTKRIAVVGYTLDPRHVQKQGELWDCELLGENGEYYTSYELRKRNRHSQYAYVSAKKSYVPQYMIFMKLKRTGLLLGGQLSKINKKKYKRPPVGVKI